MRGAVEPARAEYDRVGMRLGGVDELFQRLVGLLVVDQEQHRVGDEARQRDEIRALGLHRAAEQLVDLGVAGNAGVVGQQRVAVRLGGGDHLRADLTGRAGLGLDHHRLLEDRLHERGQRPRHDLVDAAGWEGVDDGDRVRGIGLVGECGPRSVAAAVPMMKLRRSMSSSLFFRSFRRSFEANRAPPMTAARGMSSCPVALALHAADRPHRVFDAGGVGVPELGEFRLIEELTSCPRLAIAVLNWSVVAACLSTVRR